MRAFIVLFIIFLYNTSSGRISSREGHFGSHSSTQSREYRVLKTFTHSDASVWLVVREAGHMVGQPWQVELRVRCQSSPGTASNGTASNNDVMSLPVMDSFSVCDIKPESVMMNVDQTAIAMKTKLVDMDDYNNQMASGTVDVKPNCAKATRVKIFSLENLCQPNG